MGHVNIQTLKNTSMHKSLQDFTLQSHVQLSNVCKGCAMGKKHKATYPTKSPEEPSSIPGEILHTKNLWYNVTTITMWWFLLQSYKGWLYSYRFVVFLKAKSDNLRFFIKILRYIAETTDNHVKTLGTNRGKEFCNVKFDLLLEREGITHEKNTSYTPQHNGYIKWNNIIVCEVARSILHLHNLPIKLWAESIHITVYFLNWTIILNPKP